MVGIIVAVHMARQIVLTPEGDQNLIVWLAFIPARLFAGDELPGGTIGLVWSVFTHALLHADWTHVLFNSVWLAIFGTPVARRYGAMGFMIVFFLGAGAGAIAFTVTTYPSIAILLGASGGVAALTGAAVRFIFSPIAVVVDPETGERRPVGRPTLSYAQLMRNSRARGLTLVWLILNGLAPVLPALFGAGAEFQIAWQAHIGGFIAGLVLVDLLDWWARRAYRPAP